MDKTTLSFSENVQNALPSLWIAVKEKAQVVNGIADVRANDPTGYLRNAWIAIKENTQVGNGIAEVGANDQNEDMDI